MSYFTFDVTCNKCGKTVTTSFGIVDMTIIGEPIKKCECGGEFKQKDYSGKSRSDTP